MIQYALIQRTLGLLISLFSFAFIPPALVSLWFQDGHVLPFVKSAAIYVGIGLILWWPFRARSGELRHRDGFIVVALYWVVLSLLSALPFVFGPHVALVDAVFEAVSGFTTTGATVLVGLDQMAPSFLFYRAETQWLGGMGVIVLAVALLPLLKVGGMQMYRAETPGPMKDERLTPRIAQTARILWIIYLFATIVCGICYWLAGMTPFDAMLHSFATLSTGGMSSHDASFAYFKSWPMEAIACVFMIFGAINFAVHFLAWHGRSLRFYWENAEVRYFLQLVLVASSVIAVIIFTHGNQPDFTLAIRDALFQTVSFVTSTGFVSADYTVWQGAAVVGLFFIACVGGCGGSTAGGMKVIRIVLLFKQLGREVNQLIHPSSYPLVKLSGKVVPERTEMAVWGFFTAYMITAATLMFLLMLDGRDQTTAFSIVVTCLNNTGPGLGEVGANFALLSPTSKIIAIIAMLLGRLEIFTFFLLITHGSWRH